MARILVLYYSALGHTELMALAAATGARRVEGAIVDIKRVHPIGRPDAPEPGSAREMVSIAIPDDLKNYDGFVFATPTRFGNMCAEMRYFLDQTGVLWAEGALIDKVAAVMVSTGSQHGGAETTITSFHHTLFHHGMIVVGLTYALPGLVRTDEVSGGSPYGAGTIAGSGDERQPTDNEFDLAEAQGQRVAEIATRLYGATPKDN
jgi:NAD(P)H dehydrogenase (quinone)